MYRWEDAKFYSTEGGLNSSFGGTNKVYNPLKGISPYGWHFEQEVYLPEGIARAVKAGGGSGNIPKVILEDDEPYGGKMPVVIGGLGEKKSNGGTQYFQQDRVYTSDGVAMCHPANIPGGSYRYLIEEIYEKWNNNDWSATRS